MTIKGKILANYFLEKINESFYVYFDEIPIEKKEKIFDDICMWGLGIDNISDIPYIEYDDENDDEIVCWNEDGYDESETEFYLSLVVERIKKIYDWFMSIPNGLKVKRQKYYISCLENILEDIQEDFGENDFDED